MQELSLENGNGQEIITNLQFRGERIILPEFVSKITKFSDRKEYTIKAKKGKVEIEEFKI